MGPTNFRHNMVRAALEDFPLSARQNMTTKLKDDDGRSFNMMGFEQMKTIFRVAGVLLLLMMVMGASMSAQSLNPVGTICTGLAPRFISFSVEPKEDATCLEVSTCCILRRL